MFFHHKSKAINTNTKVLNITLESSSSSVAAGAAVQLVFTKLVKMELLVIEFTVQVTVTSVTAVKVLALIVKS